ncbi:MAG: outer membrane protein transport protein [Gammaproteobacteria bacterium]|nr:outer membrane protein transport protein [Gammaproteobacteria bacterium]
MVHRQFFTHARIVFATLLTVTTSQGYAAGFALIEQSVSGLGNAYAGAAASAEDASTVFYNPAGLMYLSNQFVAAAHLVKPSAEFSGTGTNALGAPVTGGDGGDAGNTALIPNLYYSRKLPNDFVFGLGINAPFGLKTEYDADWVGRYHAIESDLKTININPAIAYKAAPNLSVGVGVDFQYIDAKLTQAINQTASCVGVLLAQNPGMDAPAAVAICGGLVSTADATGKIEGDDWSYGYNFGLMYDVNPGTRIGFAYRSKIKQELEGDASFTNADAFFTGIGLFVPTSLTANVTLPETASLSLYHDIDSRWAILADATWTHWDRFQELRVDYASNQPDSVTVEGWDNSMRYSLGLNYRYDSAWLLRTGIAFDEEPIPDDAHRTPRIPGNDRTWLAIGANYRYSSHVSFDAGYAHLFVADTRINNTSTTAGNITGEYDNAVDILSAQVNWTF